MMRFPSHRLLEGAAAPASLRQVQGEKLMRRCDQLGLVLQAGSPNHRALRQIVDEAWSLAAATQRLVDAWEAQCGKTIEAYRGREVLARVRQQLFWVQPAPRYPYGFRVSTCDICDEVGQALRDIRY